MSERGRATGLDFLRHALGDEAVDRRESAALSARDAGEVVCEIIEALALPVPDDVDPTDLPGYALAVAIVDRCLDRAREEGAEAAADRRDDEREYARSRGVR